MTKAGDYWAAYLFGGITADNSDTLPDIFTFKAGRYDDGRLGMAALSREIYRCEYYSSLELEGQVGRHFDDGGW